MLLLEAIATAADARGGAPAIVLDGREMSYAALDASVTRAAVALSGARVVPGTPVGLIVDDIPLHIVVLLALFRLGAPVLPLASADPPALRRSLIARAGVRAVVGAAARAA
ncbi:MAG: AMP-binding protein, partial [Alphaproteobacteria bacterium]